MATGSRNTNFPLLLILIFIFSACQANRAPEPTLTEPSLTLTPTAKLTQTHEPTSTPYPTLIPQLESNCPPGGWTQYTEKDGLANNWPRTLVVDHIGRVLIGYHIGDISLFHNGVLTSMPYTPGTPTYEINSIIPLEDGTLWVGTQGGQIALYRSGTWKMWTIQENGENTSVYGLEIAQDGRVWAATWDGIYQLQGDKWVSIGKPVAAGTLFSGKSIQLDREGGLWVGARYGLHYYDIGGWIPVTTAFEPIYEVIVIEEDRYGNLWFGYRGGLLVFDGDIWKQVYPPEDMNDEDSAWTRIESLAIGPSGKVWVIGSQNAVVYENGIWQQVSPAVGSPDIQIFKVDVDPWGAAWFISNEGVLCYNP